MNEPHYTLLVIAQDMAAKFGDSANDALTIVTTYAAQLNVPGIFEGGQSPDVEVNAATADHIVRAYEQAVWLDDTDRALNL